LASLPTLPSPRAFVPGNAGLLTYHVVYKCLHKLLFQPVHGQVLAGVELRPTVNAAVEETEPLMCPVCLENFNCNQFEQGCNHFLCFDCAGRMVEHTVRAHACVCGSRRRDCSCHQVKCPECRHLTVFREVEWS
jgi:hypothetical protein